MPESNKRPELLQREMSARGMALVALGILIIAIIALFVLQHQIDMAATGIDTAL